MTAPSSSSDPVCTTVMARRAQDRSSQIRHPRLAFPGAGCSRDRSVQTRDPEHSLTPAGPENGIDTVHDIILYSARTHGSKNALGARDIVDTINEEKEITRVVNGQEEKSKKKWQYFKLSPLSWISYETALEDTRNIGSGLRHFGMGGEGETFFNIYAQTS